MDNRYNCFHERHQQLETSGPAPIPLLSANILLRRNSSVPTHPSTNCETYLWMFRASALSLSCSYLHVVFLLATTFPQPGGQLEGLPALTLPMTLGPFLSTQPSFLEGCVHGCSSSILVLNSSCLPVHTPSPCDCATLIEVKSIPPDYECWAWSCALPWLMQTWNNQRSQMCCLGGTWP